MDLCITNWSNAKTEDKESNDLGTIYWWFVIDNANINCNTRVKMERREHFGFLLACFVLFRHLGMDWITSLVSSRVSSQQQLRDLSLHSHVSPPLQSLSPSLFPSHRTHMCLCVCPLLATSLCRALIQRHAQQPEHCFHGHLTSSQINAW